MTSLLETLRDVAAVPGAQYSCIAERLTGTVLVEHGTRPEDADAAVLWGRFVTGSVTGAGHLEDIMITGARRYHLIRQVRPDGRTPLLVYLRLDRARGNLAQARRVLAALHVGGSDPVPAQALPPNQQRIDRAPDPVRPTRRVPPGRAPAATAPAAGRSARPAPRPPTAAPPASVPLPRRPVADAARPPAAPAAAAPGPSDREPTVPGARWSDDLQTMRRLLDALRRFDDH